jgi:XRE family transcriptional regulator, regulator of sulfur utilization
MKLGTTIKELRVNAGMKQFELAEKCNISTTYMSQIESNAKEPNMSTLKEISDNLNIPLPILFYLSLDENDVKSNKRDAFKIIDQPVKSLIKEFFSNKS